MKKLLIINIIFLFAITIGHTQVSNVILSDQTIAIFMKLVPQMDEEIAGATEIIGDDKTILQMKESFVTYKPLVDKIISLEQPTARLDEFFLILLSYPVLVFYTTLNNLVISNPDISLTDDPKKLLEALLKEDKSLSKAMDKKQKETMVATIKLMQDIKAFAGDKNMKTLAKHEAKLSDFFTKNL